MTISRLFSTQPVQPVTPSQADAVTAAPTDTQPATMSRDAFQRSAIVGGSGTAGAQPMTAGTIDLAQMHATIKGLHASIELLKASIAAMEKALPAAPAATAAPSEPPAAEVPAVGTPAAETPAADASAAEAPAAETPAAPAEAPAAPTPAATYTVAPGDSLSAIAAASLGDLERWHEIFELNRDQIANPDQIFPGQVLKMPGTQPAPAAAPGPAPEAAAPAPEAASAPAEAPAPAPAPAPPPPAPAPTYTVGSGDSLSIIAGKTLGDQGRWREIFDMNRDQLSNPDQINAGQVLKLPNGASSAPAPAPGPAPANGRISDRGAIYIQQPNNWTCGPTSLTMAAAAFGVRPNNVDTVNELTGRTHTNPNDGVPDSNQIPNAAREIGLQSTQSHASSPAAVRDSLNAGRGVVLNGSLGTGGHFVYISGLNADGSFIVCDPYRPSITRWNDGELEHFAHNNPGHGNMIEIWR